MNIYEIIKKELDEKSNNWTLKDKLDYIYIRSLQLLSHDSRWYYSNNSTLKDLIFDNEPNVLALEETKVVCSSWSRIFADLATFLLINDNIDALTEGNTDPHMFVNVYLPNGSSITYDPLNKTNDFMKAKKHLPLKGIKYNNGKSIEENSYDQTLTYKKIGYQIKGQDITNIKNLIQNKKLEPKDIYKYIIENIDITGLSLIELNNYINYIMKKTANYDFSQLGYKSFNKSENGILSLVIKTPSNEYYLEEETLNGTIRISRLDNYEETINPYSIYRKLNSKDLTYSSNNQDIPGVQYTKVRQGKK